MQSKEYIDEVKKIKKGEDVIVNFVIEYLRNRELAKSRIIEFVEYYSSSQGNNGINNEEIYAYFFKQYDYSKLPNASKIKDSVGEFFVEYDNIIALQKKEYENLFEKYKLMLLFYSRIDFILYKLNYEEKLIIEKLIINGDTFKAVQKSTNLGNTKIYKRLYDGLISIKKNIGDELAMKILEFEE